MKSTLICKPDKAQGVAILDKKSYLTKVKKNLQNKAIFKPVTIDDNLIILSKFQNFFYCLRKNNNLKIEIYHQSHMVFLSYIKTVFSYLNKNFLLIE